MNNLGERMNDNLLSLGCFQELLNVIPSLQKGEPRWSELRQFGVAWWVRNINTLRRCIEKV